ncbi:MAG: hypothetical protein FJ151_03280 [Euryarchaeota archaeon]|nr:hypothetical protein [Euryarchaeota archaeon]
MSEFSFKEGKVGKGTIAAILAAVKYLVVPLIIIGIVTSILAEFAGEIIGDIRNAVIILGIPIVVFSFFRGFYPKGSRPRLVFALVAVAFVCLWIFFVLRGGQFGIDAEAVALNLDIFPLVMLFILAAALAGVYFTAEYLSYRKEWLAKRSAPPEGAPASPEPAAPGEEPAQPAPQPEKADEGGKEP